ncbi:MAG: translocation/assembly module TamB domain-containing protein [Methyloversatilis sp.]|jgi:translocation and assembly module TamB|nr:translocation/assembly module TamB domain-containing protein [Methyloversatilis sp.]MBP6195502.1 translocation/assembly module TamB domain-containing protein [Methyloversatilis sp.]
MNSTPEPAERPTEEPSAPRRSLRARSRLGGAGIALTDIALIALPFVILFWVLATEAGLRALTAAAQWAVPALQQVEVESGSLLSSPRLRSVRYDDGALRIDASGFALDWQPAALFGRRLDMAQLRLDVLRIATTPSDAPPSVPAGLSLPLGLRGPLTVGRIVLADHAKPDVDTLLLTDLQAQIDSDGVTHRLTDLSLVTPWGTLTGATTLGGDAPFALAGELAFAGTDYLARAVLGGALADGVTATLQAQGFGLSGSAQVSARPFAAQPLTALRLALDEFDPQRLHAPAPSGRWTVDADLKPRDGDALTLVGPLRAENRAAGRIDQGQLPVTALSAQIEASTAHVDLRDLSVLLAGGGDIRGTAGWRAGGDLPVQAALALRDIDTAALHVRGLPTRLGGRIDIKASGERQQFDVDLNDRGPRRLALAARGAVAQQQLMLEQAQLSAQGAQARLAGTLKLDDTLAFRLDGSLRKFDPSAFARLPAASLSAAFTAGGQVRPAIDARVALDFAPSTLMGEPLSGAVRGRIQGTRLSDADIRLDWAGNRLAVRGAFGGTSGRVQDVLDWTLDARRLGALRALTGVELAGRISGSGSLAGTLGAPNGSLKLEAVALALGDLGSVARAGVDARLEPGAQGLLHLTASATDLRSPSAPAPIESVRLDIDGTRAMHRLSADVRTAPLPAANGDAPARQSLELAARGALADGLSWSGTIDRMVVVLSSELTATLAAPAPLAASPRRVALDGAAFTLTAGGELALLHTVWTPDRVDTRGRARGFPLRLVWRDRAAGIAARAPLKLGADWSLSAALTGDETLDGRVTLFRESGDVVVSGEGRVVLAISEARAQADFSGRTASVSARIAGPDIGEARARVAVPMKRTGSFWQPDVDAHTAGEATLDVPSLAWIGRALRLDMTTAGRVQADVKMAGPLREPELSGRIDGDGLAFALADAGLKLERGQLRARFAGNTLKLDGLNFESDNARPPPDARLKAAELTREPGRLSASGEVDIATARADIAIKVQRFVPLQGGDQWLMLSGDGAVSGSASAGMKLQLALVADAGLFSVPEQSPPALGDDVVIKGREGAVSASTPLALQIDIDLGERLYFRGRGLDTRLTGRLALRDEGRGVSATGNIRTIGGRYRAYGQNLDIERGIVSFQGSLANPGLNVRAIRPDLPVQAGVEVTGTVQRPRVRLVSDTAMPDSEKLSWIVLGRGQDTAGGSDLSLLATAAGALLGGEGDGITGSLAQALGLDQISLSQASTATGPRSQVVSGSQRGTPTVGGQVVSVGKRLSSNALLTYEQGVAGATSIVKLTWNLTRHLALIGSTGTEQAVDVRYVFSFR